MNKFSIFDLIISIFTKGRFVDSSFNKNPITNKIEKLRNRIKNENASFVELDNIAYESTFKSINFYAVSMSICIAITAIFIALGILIYDIYSQNNEKSLKVENKFQDTAIQNHNITHVKLQHKNFKALNNIEQLKIDNDKLKLANENLLIEISKVPKLKSYIDGKTVKKKIFVPERLINIIV